MNFKRIAFCFALVVTLCSRFSMAGIIEFEQYSSGMEIPGQSGRVVFDDGDQGTAQGAYDSRAAMVSSQWLPGNPGSTDPWLASGFDTASVIFSAPAGAVEVDNLRENGAGSGGSRAATPEPASLVLLGTGLLVLAGLCVMRASMIAQESQPIGLPE